MKLKQMLIPECGKARPHQRKATVSEAISLLEVAMKAKLLRPTPLLEHSLPRKCDLLCDSVPK